MYFLVLGAGTIIGLFLCCGVGIVPYLFNLCIISFGDCTCSLHQETTNVSVGKSRLNSFLIK